MKEKDMEVSQKTVGAETISMKSRRGKEYKPPSVDEVIRQWASAPSQSFSLPSVKDPDGYIHDFPSYCRVRVGLTFLKMTRSNLITWKQRTNIETWLKAYYRDGIDKRCVLGVRSFLEELSQSIAANRYYPTPEERYEGQEEDRPRRASKRPPLKKAS